jgi:hypothetical protein
VHDVATLNGRVTNDVGNPIRDATVGAAVQAGRVGIAPSVVTNSSGMFSLPNVVPGTYFVRARDAEGRESLLDNVPVPGGSVTIVLHQTGTIDGTFVGFDERPMISAYASIDAHAVSASADVQGEHFRITDLAAGTYTVKASVGQRSVSQEVSVAAGRTVRLTLDGRGK